MGKGRRLVTHEVTMTVPLLWWWRLIHLRLHVGHRLSHIGEQLRLGSQELLHPCRWWLWWRLVLLLVLGSLVVVLHVTGVDVATAFSLSLNWWLINS